jgi:chromosome transmission fidelity protein 1
MLTALTHPSDEGQFFFNKSASTSPPEDITLKFQLLDPSTHFAEITSTARAVILAGGTMSPMSDYTSHLFPLLPSERITTLSCGHVIPKENLLAWNLGSGPTGKPLKFTFKNRTNMEMIDELGRALINICTIVPDGVVVFFPSYQSLADIIKRWQIITTSGTKSILERLESKKALFRESKDESVDTILSSYAQAIDTGKGGLLFSVVGGKMSEGINFSDALGRCVVIVGLPFPNINSAEWKAKISYIENATIKRPTSANDNTLTMQQITAKAKEQAREFYENACMRAVNQSVGRAIRHKGDFASVIMVDQRFGKESINGKLPGWIKEGLVEGAGEKPFANLMGRLGAFYRAKKQ